jgi:hypothetical protein
MTTDTPSSLTPTHEAQPPRRWRVRAAIAAGVAAVVAYFALGMPGMDHGPATQPHDCMTDDMPRMAADAATSAFELLRPE